jgi:hypothetical protein
MDDEGGNRRRYRERQADQKQDASIQTEAVEPPPCLEKHDAPPLQ